MPPNDVAAGAAPREAALSAWQNRLAERLAQGEGSERGHAWLAVDCMGQGLLLPLAQTREIVDAGQVVPLAHTQPWLAGVVNLRGTICTVVDLACLLGLRASADAGASEHARLVALTAGGGEAALAAGALHTALRVDRLEGLRHETEMTVDDAPDEARDVRPPFARQRWRDGQGRRWQVIDLALLVRQPTFMQIVA